MRYIKSYEEKFDINESEEYSGLYKVSIDLMLDTDYVDPIIYLQEIIDQFRVQIINMHPIGEGGGVTEVVFRGKATDIMMLLKYHEDRANFTGDMTKTITYNDKTKDSVKFTNLPNPAMDDGWAYFEEFAVPDSPIPFSVQSLPQFSTDKNRKYINLNGTSIDASGIERTKDLLSTLNN